MSLLCSREPQRERERVAGKRLGWTALATLYEDTFGTWQPFYYLEPFRYMDQKEESVY